MNWDDLRFLLALHRSGRLTKAGHLLGVAETTVTRRIARLEAELKRALFVQTGRGHYRLTNEAIGLLRNAEQMERLYTASFAGSTDGSPAGSVRVSSVPVIISRFLAPRLAGLIEAFPGLTVDLVSEARNVDLTRREADLAVRFSRPAGGGLKTKSRKLGSLEFGVFGAASSNADDHSPVPWIGYSEESQYLPQAKWTVSFCSQAKGDLTQLRVSSLDVAQEAAAAGLGKALLPRCIGRRDGRIKELAMPDRDKPLRRDVWMLHHDDAYEPAAVGVVRKWLIQLPWQ